MKKISLLLGHSDISITAKAYTHLLDGDLKVRDEFSFDKTQPVENSGESRSVEERMADVISNLIAVVTSSSSTVTAESVNRSVQSAILQPTPIFDGNPPKWDACYAGATEHPASPETKKPRSFD